MQSRRSLRLAAGALVLALPLLGSCGFGKATDRIYTPAEGTNNRDGVVKVLSAVVVAAQPNSGTFIATLSNSSTTEDASLDSVMPAGGPVEVSVGEVPDNAIVPRGYLNLADDGGGPIVTGTFDAGVMLPMTLSFASGDTVTMNVPVVFACDEWVGLDASADLAETEVESEAPTTDPSASASAEATVEAPAPGEPYDCAAVFEESE